MAGHAAGSGPGGVLGVNGPEFWGCSGASVTAAQEPDEIARRLNIFLFFTKKGLQGLRISPLNALQPDDLVPQSEEYGDGKRFGKG